VHFVALNQFYSPDTAPTGRHLADLAQTLVARGHRVSVVASRRSYGGDGQYAADEERDGVRIHRLPTLAHGRQREGRLGSWLGFHAAALAYLSTRRLRADLLLSMTTPPWLGLTAALRGRLSRTPVAHWVMDLYPDVLVAHGLVSSGGLVARLLAGLTRVSLRQSRLVLTLGPFMHAVAERYVAPGATTAWVPLWGRDVERPAPPETVARLRKERGWGDRDVVFLYSGNMGLGHRLEEFVEAARLADPPEARWCFLGGGVRRAEVEAVVRPGVSARVELRPYATEAGLGASLAAADVHLVSLRREWQGLIVPSKLQAAFSVGRPVVFVGPEANEPAEWIRESGGGWRAGEGQVGALMEAVREACRAEPRAARGARALAFASERFSRRRNCARIAELLEAAAVYNPPREAD